MRTPKTYMYIHLWREMRVSWTIQLHSVESRVHPVETWFAFKLRRVEVRGSSQKLRRVEVWRSVIKLRRAKVRRSFTKLRTAETRSTFKLWMIKARCWWSVRKL